MKKFTYFGVHRKRFIMLSVSIFIIVGIVHFASVVFGWDIVIAGVSLPDWTSLLAVFVLCMMILMGAYYLIADDKQ